MNYQQTVGSQVADRALPDVVSVTITTSGAPILVSTYGDAVNLTGVIVSDFRFIGSTPIGNRHG